jgi:hypothetical protein
MIVFIACMAILSINNTLFAKSNGMMVGTELENVIKP